MTATNIFDTKLIPWRKTIFEETYPCSLNVWASSATLAQRKKIKIAVVFHSPVSIQAINRLPNLGAIITRTTRINQLPLDELKKKEKEILVYSRKGSWCADAIAEKTRLFLGNQCKINEPVIGLIGKGYIGNAIIDELGESYKPSWLFRDPAKDYSCSLETIFEKADVIVLACPATHETKRIITKKTIFKKQPIIINVADDSVAPLKDLRVLWRESKIKSYWSDFSLVQKMNNEFWETPHTAWVSDRAISRNVESVKKDIKKAEQLLDLMES